MKFVRSLLASETPGYWLSVLILATGSASAMTWFVRVTGYGLGTAPNTGLLCLILAVSYGWVSLRGGARDDSWEATARELDRVASEQALLLEKQGAIIEHQRASIRVLFATVRVFIPEDDWDEIVESVEKSAGVEAPEYLKK